ncbi:protein kinase domain-containing protein [Duganella radicis]|uniref:Protein kinase n=1 Tax=Duganella radicis TaxID=551988 RepID=A0A6L6PKU0_9BURK|nr:protein kinase [Duganella radicis]MTV39572.1 protein kinase [Duganella radicis]
MQLTLHKKLGDGAFADVWHATDQLERDVAVKIVRPANVGVADALAHAKALARASHPNVVAVLTLEQVDDPDGKGKVDCVVMELIRGQTLAETFEGEILTLKEVESLGLGILDGLAHIHAQGLAHGDLHEENIMVAEGVAKVIDILYLNSLATLSTEKKSSRLRKDILGLRLMLQQLIIHSELDSAEATEFNNLLESDSAIDDIRSAFLSILNPDTGVATERALEHAFARLTEEAFVDGPEYAEALAEETADETIVPLFKKLIESNSYESRQQTYIELLWDRLGDMEKKEVALEVGKILDVEMPKGRWVPGLRLLYAFGRKGWDSLGVRLRVKLEGLIVKDVLAGHKDIHSTKKLNGGALGTHANRFWRRFSHPEVLADNLVSLLRQNWYTQNYVGEYFFKQIPAIARATDKREDFIAALKSAVANDARLIARKIDDLPDDWIVAIHEND